MAMKYIYELSHFYEDEDGYDIFTEIAVYSSLEKAEKALEKFKLYPKFESHPEAFNISRCEIDKDDWPEGFVPY
jgi:hypothetical protein